MRASSTFYCASWETDVAVAVSHHGLGCRRATAAGRGGTVKIGESSVVKITVDTISKIRGGPLQHNMVRLGLFLQAELDGVTDVCPIDTADDPYFYTFKVQCGSCREVNANWVDISRQVPPTSTNADLLIVSGEGQYQRK